jgi:hypothetical protein
MANKNLFRVPSNEQDGVTKLFFLDVRNGRYYRVLFLQERALPWVFDGQNVQSSFATEAEAVSECSLWVDRAESARF